MIILYDNNQVCTITYALIFTVGYFLKTQIRLFTKKIYGSIEQLRNIRWHWKTSRRLLFWSLEILFRSHGRLEVCNLVHLSSLIMSGIGTKVSKCLFTRERNLNDSLAPDFVSIFLPPSRNSAKNGHSLILRLYSSG